MEHRPWDLYKDRVLWGRRAGRGSSKRRHKSGPALVVSPLCTFLRFSLHSCLFGIFQKKKKNRVCDSLSDTAKAPSHHRGRATLSRPGASATPGQHHHFPSPSLRAWGTRSILTPPGSGGLQHTGPEAVGSWETEPCSSHGAGDSPGDLR